MPSRDIKDCVGELQLSWKVASAEYKKLYPNDPQPVLTCTYRSEKEQRELYAKGRTAPGKIVTNIKSGGKHNRMPSEAYDITFKKGEKVYWNGEYFRKFAEIIKRVAPGVKWGGDWKSFKDLPHFEV